MNFYTSFASSSAICLCAFILLYTQSNSLVMNVKCGIKNTTIKSSYYGVPSLTNAIELSYENVTLVLPVPHYDWNGQVNQVQVVDCHFYAQVPSQLFYGKKLLNQNQNQLWIWYLICFTFLWSFMFATFYYELRW